MSPDYVTASPGNPLLWKNRRPWVPGAVRASGVCAQCRLLPSPAVPSDRRLSAHILALAGAALFWIIWGGEKRSSSIIPVACLPLKRCCLRTLSALAGVKSWIEKHQAPSRAEDMPEGQRNGPLPQCWEAGTEMWARGPSEAFGLSVTSRTIGHCCRQHVHFNPWCNEGGKNPWQDFYLGPVASLTCWVVTVGECLKLWQCWRFGLCEIRGGKAAGGGGLPFWRRGLVSCCSNERGGTSGRLLLSGYWSRALCLTAWTSEGILSFSLNSPSLFSTASVWLSTGFWNKETKSFLLPVKLNPL